jgi:DNA-binding transcriptional LysR family regulator
MEIRNFKSFKKIAETGSFTKAAEALGCTQSTLTAQMKALEAFYAQPVFERLGKSIRLTAFGQRLLKSADALIELYDNVRDLGEAGAEPQGAMRIGSPESLMMYRLFGILKEYKTLYPQVEISIVNDNCGQIRSLVASGDLDIGFTLQPDFAYQNLTVIALREEPLCFVAPGSYKGDDFVPDDRHMLLSTERECMYRRAFDEYLAGRNYCPRNVLETQSVEAIKKFIVNDMGFSFLPRYAVRAEAESGLVCVKPYEGELRLYSQIVFHKNKWLSPALSRLIELSRARSAEWAD